MDRVLNVGAPCTACNTGRIYLVDTEKDSPLYDKFKFHYVCDKCGMKFHDMADKNQQYPAPPQSLNLWEDIQ